MMDIIRLNNNNVKLGTFYNILMSICNDGKISSIDEAVSRFKEIGISYYEVSADLIDDMEHEKNILLHIESNDAYVGNLYFKREVLSFEKNAMDKLYDDTRKKIEQCARLHSPLLMPVIIVKSKEILQTNDCEDRIIEYYNNVSDMTKTYSIATVFENSSRPNINNFTVDEVVRMLNNTKNVGYILDTGNFWFTDEDVLPSLDDYVKKVEGVHLKDILPFSEEEFINTKQYVDCMPIGKGDTNIEKILKYLLSKGYNKNLTIELNGYNNGLAKILASVNYIKSIGVNF